MKKKKVFQINFETVYDKPTNELKYFPLTWDIIRKRHVYIVANSVEEAILFARQNFVALTSKLAFEETEHPVDIKDVSLYMDEVYI